MKKAGNASIGPLLASVALLICAPQGWAAKCTISSSGLNFGVYDSLSVINTNGTGTLSVDCNGQRIPHTIALSEGISGSFSPRTMASGVRRLQYNLYIDAARTNVWGDGIAAGTSTLAGEATTAIYTVYGRIPSQQKASAGIYTDNIIVTVTF
jgi:spore coat protein U-like protein